MESRFHILEAWLAAQKSRQSRVNLLVGVGSLLLGVLALLATFCCVYLVLVFVWAMLGPLLGWPEARGAFLHPPGVILIATLVFIGLLFVGNARTTREYLGDLPVNNCEWRWALSNPDPGAELLTTAKWVTDLLYLGPRLVIGFFGFLRKASAWRNLDEINGARLLAALTASGGPVLPREVEFDDMEADSNALAGLLADLDGIIWVGNRLTLTPEFRVELHQQLYASV
jgi:hypothetical protein